MHDRPHYLRPTDVKAPQRHSGSSFFVFVLLCKNHLKQNREALEVQSMHLADDTNEAKQRMITDSKLHKESHIYGGGTLSPVYRGNHDM